MSDKLNRELLMELGEAEDQCRSISVGGTMFDDAILSQPPTPQNLVDVLGWTDYGTWQESKPHHRNMTFDTSANLFWIIDYIEDARIPVSDIPTLRDVVDLCRLLGIPCEVKRS